jgi:hypothetical protein
VLLHKRVCNENAINEKYSKEHRSGSSSHLERHGDEFKLKLLEENENRNLHSTFYEGL